MRTTVSLMLSLVVILSAASGVRALPRFSLLTGTRCSACHFDPQGSGIRTELGWSYMNNTGAFKWTRSNEGGTTDGNGFEDLENTPSDTNAVDTLQAASPPH